MVATQGVRAPLFRPHSDHHRWIWASPGGRAKRGRRFCHGGTPAPADAETTAVWLLDNIALWFDEIAEFCKLHPLEVKAIADGDAAQGIKGMDPILTGQLTREQITAAEADHRQSA